ncbi:MAG: PDZ domain-containing protein [Verrucomicrobiota bacterium]
MFPWLLLPLFFAPLVAEEGEKAAVPAAEGRGVHKPLPWVGLTIGKLSEQMRHHATGVPQGVGFLIDAVDPEGPAKAGGVRRFDILWKLDDQLLINEAQFATLLRMRDPGDEIRVSVIRSGNQIELDLTLREMPQNRKVAKLSPTDLPLMPTGVEGLPKVVTRPQDRTAELSRADGSLAKLRYEGEVAHVVISDPEGEIVYDGPVREDGVFLVPDDWKSAVGAMLRSLYKAKNPNWVPRRPRPRTVVPPDRGDR